MLRDADGAISHHITSSIDLTEVKLAEARFQHLAHHDTLTGLPNRVHLLQRLSETIAAARREASQLAVLFIGSRRSMALRRPTSSVRRSPRASFSADVKCWQLFRACALAWYIAVSAFFISVSG